MSSRKRDGWGFEPKIKKNFSECCNFFQKNNWKILKSFLNRPFSLIRKKEVHWRYYKFTLLHNATTRKVYVECSARALKKKISEVFHQLLFLPSRPLSPMFSLLCFEDHLRWKVYKARTRRVMTGMLRVYLAGDFHVCIEQNIAGISSIYLHLCRQYQEHRINMDGKISKKNRWIISTL